MIDGGMEVAARALANRGPNSNARAAFDMSLDTTFEPVVPIDYHTLFHAVYHSEGLSSYVFVSCEQTFLLSIP